MIIGVLYIYICYNTSSGTRLLTTLRPQDARDALMKEIKKRKAHLQSLRDKLQKKIDSDKACVSMLPSTWSHLFMYAEHDLIIAYMYTYIYMLGLSRARGSDAHPACYIYIYIYT